MFWHFMKWVRVPAESEAPVVGTRRRFTALRILGCGGVGMGSGPAR